MVLFAAENAPDQADHERTPGQNLPDFDDAELCREPGNCGQFPHFAGVVQCVEYAESKAGDHGVAQSEHPHEDIYKQGLESYHISPSVLIV